MAFLRDQAIEGRLTADELDERVGRAYAAVTRGDLDALVVDLPHPPTRPQYVRPARRSPPLAPLALATLFVLSLPWLLGTAPVGAAARCWRLPPTLQRLSVVRRCF